MILGILGSLVTHIRQSILVIQVIMRRKVFLVGQVGVISIVAQGRLLILVSLPSLFWIAILFSVSSIRFLVVLVILVRIVTLFCLGPLSPLASLGSIDILLSVAILVSIICLGFGLLAANPNPEM